MNAFNRIISYLNLDSTHQGEQGWLHSLLAYAASDYEGADTYTNPVTEALYRLEARGVGKPTLDRIRQLLNTLENGFNAGSIR